MKKNIAIMLALTATTALAQTKTTGEAEVKGGMGSENPLAASLKLKFDNGKLIFSPYASISIIGKNASTTNETKDYTYVRTGSHYISDMERKSSGSKVNYGFHFNYTFLSNDYITASLDGSHLTKDTDVKFKERLTNTAGEAAYANGAGNSPFSTKENDLKASVGYRHYLDREGQTIGIKYQFANNTLDEDNTLRYFSSRHMDQQTENHIIGKQSVQDHLVTLDWEKSFLGIHYLQAGASYLNRVQKSDDSQAFESLNWENEHFKHTMKTTSAFARYKLTTSHFDAHASLSYEYTDMNGKALNDIVPNADVTWKMDGSSSLKAAFSTRIVRPTLNYLNPTYLRWAFEEVYSTAKVKEVFPFVNCDIEGIHLKNFSLVYLLRKQKVTFSTALAHIFTDDGFNAIWIEQNEMRKAFWGNEGVRRAWSLTPDVEWRVSPKTVLGGKVNVIWDKRIAYAIGCANEHWGVTTQARLMQTLPLGIKMKLQGDYSEGNTIDLYSHYGRMLHFGAGIERSFLKDKRLTAALSYDYTDYAKVIFTQDKAIKIPNSGFYTGYSHIRPSSRNAASLSLKYKF